MGKKVSKDGRCKLCGNTRTLALSHIVPKFMIREAGLLGAGFSIKCISEPEFTEWNKQDGIKEYLLCHECEEKISVWEHYAREKFFGKGNPFVSITENGLLWTGLDYTKMKLFILSLLWRMDVCSHPFYAHVDLGDKHERAIREMLLNENPREAWRYGCILGFLYYGSKPMARVFSQPQQFTDEDNRKGYRFVLTNFVLFIDVASHAPPLAKQLAYLQSSGVWAVPSAQALSIKFVKDEIDRLRANH